MPRFHNNQIAWGVAAAALTISLCARPAAADIIYDNTFEFNSNGFSYISNELGFPGGTVPFTTLPTTAGGFGSTPNSRFLGVSQGPSVPNQQFGFAGNTTLTLTLTGLTPGNKYLLGFDLFMGKTVEGNAGALGGVQYGPDRFQVTASGTKLIDTTFNNYGADDTGTNANATKIHNAGQSYADNDLTGFNAANPALSSKHDPFTGADVAYNPTTGPGSTNALNNYSIYYFGRFRDQAPKLLFTATDSTVAIQWQSTWPGRDYTNEFWALDNVQVADLPEPGTLGMMALGAIPMMFGLFKMRRRK